MKKKVIALLLMTILLLSVGAPAFAEGTPPRRSGTS